MLVRDPLGRVFVHRRTDTKDVYPGRYDFTAGGVLLAGEDPTRPPGARPRRSSASPRRSCRSVRPTTATTTTTYHAFLYETVWDGPVRLQPEEVASASG